MTGAVVGVLLLVALAGVVFVLWRRQRQQSGLGNTQGGSSPHQANFGGGLHEGLGGDGDGGGGGP